MAMVPAPSTAAASSSMTGAADRRGSRKAAPPGRDRRRLGPSARTSSRMTPLSSPSTGPWARDTGRSSWVSSHRDAGARRLSRRHPARALRSGSSARLAETAVDADAVNGDGVFDEVADDQPGFSVRRRSAGWHGGTSRWPAPAHRLRFQRHDGDPTQRAARRRTRTDRQRRRPARARRPGGQAPASARHEAAGLATARSAEARDRIGKRPARHRPAPPRRTAGIDMPRTVRSSTGRRARRDHRNAIGGRKRDVQQTVVGVERQRARARVASRERTRRRPAGYPDRYDDRRDECDPGSGGAPHGDVLTPSPCLRFGSATDGDDRTGSNVQRRQKGRGKEAKN